MMGCGVGRPADAEAVLSEAGKACWTMVGVRAVIWVVQLVNWADGYGLSVHYGIHTRDVTSLPTVLTAPFLHFGWGHIEGNSGPLFIFVFLAAFGGVKRFLSLTALIVLVSCAGAWLTSVPCTLTSTIR